VSTTILLAVDVQHYAPEATGLARELSQDAGGKVIVLHVHEFAGPGPAPPGRARFHAPGCYSPSVSV
jgi:hypothetical protein